MVDVFVVGAAKAGTSWLYQCFKEHPEIYVGDIKEHNQFTYNFENGFKEYLNYFSKSHGIKVDVSPSYLASITAPSRIYSFNPNAKILFILRSPVDRAYSHYCMLLKGGLVSKDVFSEITTSKHSDRLLGDGYYYRHIVNYLKFFKKESVAVFFYDQLSKDPATFLNQIYEYLNLNSDFIPSLIDKKFHAAKTLPKNQLVYNLLTKLSGFGYRNSTIFRALLNKLRVSGVLNIFHTLNKGEDYPNLQSNQVQKLISYYLNDIKSLENYLEVDLSHWYSFNSTK